jgi:hypothetical protein
VPLLDGQGGTPRDGATAAALAAIRALGG